VLLQLVVGYLAATTYKVKIDERTILNPKNLLNAD